MPYIKQEMRSAIDAKLDQLVETVNQTVDGDENLLKGVMNYTITTLINKVYPVDSYSKFNDIMGILKGVDLEFYRRRVVPYENQKIFENGDCYPNPIETEVTTGKLPNCS